jgi:hypothetical protein
MDKFTLFELHVHDGMEFSATNTAPAIGRSDDEEHEEHEELEEYVESDEGRTDDADESDADSSSDGGVGPVGLVVGLVVLAGLAFAVRKLRGGDAELEIAELDDLSEHEGGEEAEH